MTQVDASPPRHPLQGRARVSLRPQLDVPQRVPRTGQRWARASGTAALCLTVIRGRTWLEPGPRSRYEIRSCRELVGNVGWGVADTGSCRGQRMGPGCAQPGASKQNSLPSGSARTVHGTSTGPRSMAAAPRAATRLDLARRAAGADPETRFPIRAEWAPSCLGWRPFVGPADGFAERVRAAGRRLVN